MQTSVSNMPTQNGSSSKQGALAAKLADGGRQGRGSSSSSAKRSNRPASVASSPLKKDELGGGAYHSITSIYGYNERQDMDNDESDATEEAEPSFMQALRRGSLTKTQSERKLAQDLNLVKDCEHNDRREEKRQELKDRFNGSKPTLRNKLERRGSMSSITSQGSAMSQTSMSYTGSTGILSRCSDPAGSLSGDWSVASKQADTGLGLSSHAVAGARSMDASLHTLGASSHTAYTQNGMSFNQSASTLPVANVVKSNDVKKNAIKTDQIIESLVWFSFHTPRTVLEDLIGHEMELWRLERMNSARKLINAENMSRSSQRSALGGEGEDGSFSSISDDGGARAEVFGNNFSEAMIQLQGRTSGSNMIKLPKCVERESALLFVDMSGFTKLSTMLDVESLSKVINSYFDMIVSEVIQYGGDILKFAGDAFFAEWKVVKDDDDDCDADNPLADLNASLASINEIAWDDDDDIPALSNCVLSAARCGASIVKKFSDYKVSAISSDGSQAMLNVHCGVGVGHLVGLHVGDFKEDQEEEGVELRREFLILGEPIDQVSIAADIATDGEVMASPQALLSLAFVCDMSDAALNSTEPVCIASRDKDFLGLDNLVPAPFDDDTVPMALQPYESLRMHCKELNHTALARLHIQMALYVHPVIRGDELALSAAIQAGKISQPTETLESRHRAEAELRSVYTIFIKAVLSPRITGMKEIDEDLYQNLADIMHVTSRELDRYSGHLRQFIVDDKGVVLIATFGLRGSTFPSMVANNALPATFAIHRALKTELNVENRIGATFGKVYCGVVGGVRRHEFAVMGAPVNLAARLMSSKENRGILVDEAVGAQAENRFVFNKLPPVKAKGYDKPVPILEPLHAVEKRKKKSSVAFIGRKEEKLAITSIARNILEAPLRSQSSMVFLMGELGMGKSVLALSVIDELKKFGDNDKMVATARSSSTEMEQRIPLSAYRRIFMSLVENMFANDDSTLGDKSFSSRGSKGSGSMVSLRSLASLSKRGGLKSSSFRRGGLSKTVEEDQQHRPSLTRSPGGLDILSQLSLLPGPDGKVSEDIEDMSVLSQSLRDISADLTLEPKRGSKHEPSKKYIPNSLSKSMHGVSARRYSAGFAGDSLGRSLHTSSQVSMAHLPHGRSPGATTPIPQATSLRSSSRGSKSALKGVGDDGSVASGDVPHDGAVPYFEKLCLVCEELDYPYEYADIVGSQFLGLDGASPVTHVEGHVPTMDELVEFLALAFICLADYADLSVIFIDDFQWVDSFSWKIFRVLCKRGKKLLLICAMRSHDKQALRRLSTAASQETGLQSIEISLGPLDYTEIRSLAANVLGHKEGAISDTICTDVFQRTGGLPVYVVQLLENIKRNKTLELENGVLVWTAEGLREKRAAASSSHGAVMEETFLSRFDALDVRVRKVLQTCAVLGLSFAMSDVIKVHPELEESDLEHALDCATDEMILLEQIEHEEEEDNASLKSGSSGESADNFDRTDHTSGANLKLHDRFFQFSHAMWRKNVLTTMLKERKIELHRSIAEAMEKDQVMILEQSDISRLLTLFDHWKSCGDFSKSAPLALAVGSRLEEWDLSAQSLELYEDALEMSFDSVHSTGKESAAGDEEWVQVAATPGVWDLILRLHIRIGLCHQNLGEDYESISYFEDAYTIIKTSSKIPGMSKSLLMPVISTLAVLKLGQEAHDSRTRKEQEKLLETFVAEASDNGSPVHVGRALAMEAKYFATLGRLDEALKDVDKLVASYDIKKHSADMVEEYGRDFALECITESIQWLYLNEEHEKAEEQVDYFIEHFLPILDPSDTDNMLYCIFPVLYVLMLLGRPNDADWLLKKYAINPYHDSGNGSQHWVMMFNPLAYLLEVIMMEETEQIDWQLLEEMGEWVLDEDNGDFDLDLRRKADTIMGELCWRLASFKEEQEEDSGAEALLERARDLLEPIARYPHSEIFLKHTAQALLEALDA